MGFIHWGFVPSTDFDFTIIYLKLIQLCVLVYYFCSQAAKQLKLPNFEKRYLIPAMVVLLLFLTTVAILAISGVFDKNNFYACFNPSFALYDTVEILLCMAFLITGLITSRQIGKTNVSGNIRKRNQTTLWRLVLVYLITTFITSGWDIGYDFYHLSNKAVNCNQIFSGEWEQAILQWLLRVINLLVPLWGALYVFYSMLEKTQSSNPQKPQYDYEPIDLQIDPLFANNDQNIVL